MPAALYVHGRRIPVKSTLNLKEEKAMSLKEAITDYIHRMNPVKEVPEIVETVDFRCKQEECNEAGS